MTDKEAKIWKEGYEAGVKAIMRDNSDAIKIGEVILNVMYDKFETIKEDY